MAINFINGRYQDRIGVVVFAGEAYSLVPLTTDYDLLRESIKNIHLDMFSNDGTAIGNALGVAINRMRESSAVSKVGILISDGENQRNSEEAIEEQRVLPIKDYYQIYLKWAILFFLLWLALKNTFFCNALED